MTSSTTVRPTAPHIGGSQSTELLLLLLLEVVLNAMPLDLGLLQVYWNDEPMTLALIRPTSVLSV